MDLMSIRRAVHHLTDPAGEKGNRFLPATQNLLIPSLATILSVRRLRRNFAVGLFGHAALCRGNNERSGLLKFLGGHFSGAVQFTQIAKRKPRPFRPIRLGQQPLANPSGHQKPNDAQGNRRPATDENLELHRRIPVRQKPQAHIPNLSLHKPNRQLGGIEEDEPRRHEDTKQISWFPSDFAK